MKKEVVITYLEMLDPSELRPAAETDLKIIEAEIPSPELSRFLYTSVGSDWTWVDRLGWPYEKWLAYLDRPELRTWVGYYSGTPAGYFELEAQPGNNVEVASFGILPAFVGQGHGGHLLTRAVTEAWGMDAARVWLHTCSLDHPHAIRNYVARGFKVFKEEDTYQEVPDDWLPGPWTGSNRQDRPSPRAT